MIEVVMDTSSLVSLQMINILTKSLKIIKIIVPKAVKEELNDISKHKDNEGKAAKEVLEFILKGNIKTIEIKNQKKVENLLSKDVNYGEAECFVSCIENDIKTLVMDDIDAAYILEGIAITNKIKMKISVAVLIELYREKIIDKLQLKNHINSLIKIRQWESGVLEVLAKKYLENI